MGLLAWAFWKILLPPGRHVTPWLLTSCQHGFLWAAKLELLWQAARVLRRLWGPKVTSWCQSTFIEKPNSEGKKSPSLPPLHRASWHPRSVHAGTLPLVLGAGFCCGWHGEGDYLHCGFWWKPSLSYCINSTAQGWPSTKLGLPSLLTLSCGPQVCPTKGLSRFLPPPLCSLTENSGLREKLVFFFFLLRKSFILI